LRSSITAWFLPSILMLEMLILLSLWLEFFVGGFGTVNPNIHLWTPHSLLKYRSLQLTGAAEALGDPLCPPHISQWLASRPIWDVWWKQRHEDSLFSPSISVLPSVSFHQCYIFTSNHTINAQNIVWVSASNRTIHKNFEILKHREKFQVCIERNEICSFLTSRCIHTAHYKMYKFSSQ
jgi:hypothetical protein